MEGAKRLWVIGAGPAGLSAALAAAGRGYEVEIFEKEGVPGGQVQSAGRPPHKKSYLEWVGWSIRQMEKCRVKIHYDREMTAEMWMEKGPDAVVLAAGAHPVTPEIRGIDSPQVVDARDLLVGKVQAAGPAVVLGAGYVGMETADFLIARGIEVVLVEMLHSAPVGRHTTHGYWLHKRIREGGGRIILGAMVTRIEEGAVIYRQGDEEKKISAALVVTAMGAKPDNGLEGALKESGISYRIVGDAKSPRRLLEAIHEGDQAGREI